MVYRIKSILRALASRSPHLTQPRLSSKLLSCLTHHFLQWLDVDWGFLTSAPLSMTYSLPRMLYIFPPSLPSVKISWPTWSGLSWMKLPPVVLQEPRALEHLVTLQQYTSPVASLQLVGCQQFLPNPNVRVELLSVCSPNAPPPHVHCHWHSALPTGALLGWVNDLMNGGNKSLIECIDCI